MHTELARLLDARAIERVFVDYFDRVDAADAEGAAGLFAEDATFEIMTGKTYQGRDAYARVLGRVLAQYERTSHHMSNHRSEIDGEVASAVTYVYAYHRLRETGRPWHLWARIVNKLAKRDGRWEVTEHVLHGVDHDPPWPAVHDEWFRGHPGRFPSAT